MKSSKMYVLRLCDVMLIQPKSANLEEHNIYAMPVPREVHELPFSKSNTPFPHGVSNILRI